MSSTPAASSVAAASLHIVAMPYPGRGHINPMLCLCRQLVARCAGLAVTVVVTEEWRGLLEESSQPLPPSIELRTMPNVVPSEFIRGENFIGFLEATHGNMAAPFAAILDGSATAADAIIADMYLPWAVDAGDLRGIPVYCLYTMSATFFAISCHHDGIPLPFRRRRDELLGSIPARCMEFILNDIAMARHAHRFLFTTCYELESRVVDELNKDMPRKGWTVGPSIPYMLLREHQSAVGNGDGDGCLSWLDKQPDKSVLYVSLGSFLSVSPEQLAEIVHGVRKSGFQFLWVARGDTAKVLEMSGDSGKVVPWCNQLEVLGHRTIGGFLTHGGWNSTLEAVFSGVPVLVFPLAADQHTDCRLVADEWQVGFDLTVDRNAGGVVGRDTIAAAVKKMMDLEDAESSEVRRRSSELRDACRSAVVEGGSSYNNITSLLQELASLKSC